MWLLAATAAATIIGLPCYLKYRKVSLRNECLNNLRQIDGPTTCCVPLANRLAVGDKMDPKVVAQYIKGNTIPRCPCGPEYEYSWIVGSPPPKCPYHGALLETNTVLDWASASHSSEAPPRNSAPK